MEKGSLLTIFSQAFYVKEVEIKYQILCKKKQEKMVDNTLFSFFLKGKLHELQKIAILSKFFHFDVEFDISYVEVYELECQFHFLYGVGFDNVPVQIMFFEI